MLDVSVFNQKQIYVEYHIQWKIKMMADLSLKPICHTQLN